MHSIENIWHQYLSSGGEASFLEFGVYLIQQAETLGKPDVLPVIKEEAKPPMLQFMPPDSLASIIVGRLERFMFLQAKPRLKKAGIDNTDDFSLLATLFSKPGITKGQLLKQVLIEPATGTEMLKRMKKAGWVRDEANPNDGRSMLVYLTEKGQAITMACFAALSEINDVLSSLTESEQLVLLKLLTKLDDCHSERAGIATVQQWMLESYGRTGANHY